MARRKKRNSVWAIVLLLLLAAAVFFAAKTGKNQKPESYSEERVWISEIKGELGFGIYAQEDWDSWFLNFHENYLTLSMLEELVGKLGADEYIELPAGTKQHAVARVDWNRVYGQILDLLDMEGEITSGSFLVLGTMEAEKENVIITNLGDYYTSLPVTFFEEWRVYDIYAAEDVCVGIAGVSKEEAVLPNAYLKSCTDGKISFLFGGSEYEREAGQTEGLASGVCDLVFAEGALRAVRTKTDLIEGGLLSYDDSTIEIEGYGKISHEGKLPVYQTYGEIAEKSLSDVILGNMKVQYVTGDNQVCAILIGQPAEIKNIRVLLLEDGGAKTRGEVYLKCSVPAVLTCGERQEQMAADTPFAASDYLAADSAETLVLAPATEDGQIYICDASGTARSNGYAGMMEVRAQGGGYTLVNQLPFETYLCAVVPSEMPSSYAPEALKAQAVCARSYAYIQLLRADLAEYGAHIDDSTSYQVYNKSAPTDASIAAVSATAGQVLTYRGETIEAYYFSTSMGYTDTVEVWNVADTENTYGYLRQACLTETPCDGDLADEAVFLSYIKQTQAGYDSDVKFYRWFASADYRGKTEEINQILKSRSSAAPGNILYYEADGVTEAKGPDGMGGLVGIASAERSHSGAILTLRLQYENGVALVKTEYNIRKILGCGVQKMVYADESESTEVSMLPSAFCAITAQEDGTCMLNGGGYGHGLGMSQNGANGMAKAGMGYEEILRSFYQDIEIETM